MLLTLQNVTWQQRGQSLVQNVSLSLAAGEVVTVIGPNGAGKTSLLKLVTGLANPSSGTIIRKPGLRIGYMPQRLAVAATMPITVHRFLQLQHNKLDEFQNHLQALAVPGLLNRQLQHLSGGELQRVLLARALLRSPELLVLDEPTQGVDVGGQAELYRIIAELRDRLGCAVLMVSHDLHLVMAQTDTVICLNKHVCCHGTPESVEQHPEYLQLFGRQASNNIAVYTHHHDHQHDLQGEVVSTSCNHSHD